MFIIEDKLSNTMLNLDLAYRIARDSNNSENLIVEFDASINTIWFNHLVNDVQRQMNMTIELFGTYRIYDFSMERFINALEMGYNRFEQHIRRV